MNNTNPSITLSAPVKLMDTDTCKITVEKLLTANIDLSEPVQLHQHTAKAGGMVFICVPASHMLSLDLDDCTIKAIHSILDGYRYTIVFGNYDQALAYLSKHYGFDQAYEIIITTAAASPCSSAIVIPENLPTPPRLTRRLLSTTAFSPYGVIHMSKKQPIRVFLEQEIHSRYLIQAGTHGLTPSALAERLIESGLSQLERGDKAPLTPSVGSASPAPHSKEA